jgi:PST family polysaccharide transporter
VQFAQRALLSNQLGLGAAGQFQAAASLSVVYVGFILQAMSQDFFPRLTGLARDDGAATRLVNQQIELSLLLAGPGLLATVALAPWLLTTLYSGEFHEADELLRWQCLGVLLRVASWPLGFVIVARADVRLYLVTEVGAQLVHMLVFYALLQAYGLIGAAFGLIACYAFYLAAAYLAARRVIGFSWTPAALRVQSLVATAYVVCLIGLKVVPGVGGTSLAVAVAGLFGLYAYRELGRMTSVPLAAKAVGMLVGLTRRRRAGRASPR